MPIYIKDLSGSLCQSIFLSHSVHEDGVPCSSVALNFFKKPCLMQSFDLPSDGKSYHLICQAIRSHIATVLSASMKFHTQSWHVNPPSKKKGVGICSGEHN